MTKIDCIIIAAAGSGTRLNQKLPKALIDITKNKKLIDFQMDLLRDINDIRVVVGYKGNDLSSYILNKYENVKIIENPNYDSTSICNSIHMATMDLNEPYIVMCSDLLINKNEFNNFINSFDGESLLGITPSKTQDSIYVSTNEDNEVTSFQKDFKTNFEWANLACISKSIEIDKNSPSLFLELEKYLPLKYFLFENCFEIDTDSDLNLALKNLDKL